MKNSNKRIGFLLFIFYLSIYCSMGQEASTGVLRSQEDLLKYTNEIYGSDDRLINGRIYVPLHSLAEGHPYFQSIDWVFSDLYIKGNSYPGVQVKYDIELDEFILFIRDKFDRKNYIVLNRHYVDSVQIGKFLFVNTQFLPDFVEDIGYVEMVYRKDFYFVVKYDKDFKKEFSESKPYGEYNQPTNDKYINESGVLTKLNTKKALYSYFEPQKKEVKRFMKKNKIKYKKANSGELFNLIQYCDDLRKDQ